MREIKFRGKRVDKDEFAYGDHLTGMGYKKGKHYILPLLSYYPSDCHSFDGYDVIPETIGQYTGLKDKNGKEIYEGDILYVKEFSNDAFNLQFSFDEIKEFELCECKGNLLQEYKCSVSFVDGNMIAKMIDEKLCDCELYISCLFGDMRYSQPIFEFTVIGNIHDNPELIKEEEK